MLRKLTKAITGATSASPGVFNIQYQYTTAKAENFLLVLYIAEVDSVEA